MFSSQKSFTLIEIIIAVFLFVVIFMGIFGAYYLGLKIVGQSKNKTTAIAIGNAEIEKIRTLPYQSIGVIGGYPDGILEASTSASYSGLVFNIERKVDYVIDSSDGISAPEDECPNDYKKVEVKISWQGFFGGEITMTTNIMPSSLAEECEEIGGILSVSVFDAYGVMVSSPLIEIRNPDTNNVIKSATPPNGEYFFSLSPATYKITVSKNGYSSEQTYSSSEIAMPEKPHPIIIENQITEMSFSIDKVSSFLVKTLSLWTMDYFSDSFLDESQISEIYNLILYNGEVKLEEYLPGEYKSDGYLISTDISPMELLNWEEFSFNDQEPTDTQILYQVLYFDGNSWTPIPDADLSGNSMGFSTSPIDLSGLNINNYSQLRIKANFSTSNPQFTPVLYDWQVSWKSSGSTYIPNVSFHLQGEKIIGFNQDEEPVYKYSENHITDSYGEISINNLEWDSYNFSINTSGLDLAEINPSPQPIDLAPDTTITINLYLNSQNSFGLTVKDIDTALPIFSAKVRLYNTETGYDQTYFTDEKGQVYFIPLESGSYHFEIEAETYNNYYGNIDIAGDETAIANMTRVE